MRKLVFALPALLALAACGGAAQSASAPAQTSMPMPSASTAASTGPPVRTNAVTIQNYAFEPSAISVKTGTTVTWTNKDQDAHTVSFQGGVEGQASKPLQMGDVYSHTFSAPGTIQYICSIHPFMKGTVVVTP